MGRYAEAKEASLEGLSQDPDDAYLLSILAHSLLGLNDPVQGYSFMEQAVALEPHDPELLAELGIFQLAVNQRKKAVQTLRSARSINPDNRRVLLLSIHVMLTDPNIKRPILRDNILREARAVAEGARLAHPDSASVHTADGRVHLAAKDAASAEDSARRALAIDPNNANALTLLGTALAKQGRTHDAGELYIQATRADPSSSDALEELRSLSAGKMILLGIALFVMFGVLASIGGPSLLVVPLIMVLAIGGIVFLGDMLSKRSQKKTASKRLNPDAQDILDQDRRLR